MGTQRVQRATEGPARGGNLAFRDEMARRRAARETTRTWTATLEVWGDRGVVEMAVSESESDLLRDQTLTAVREASRLVDAARAVTVVIWKRTNARGVERDRTFSVYRDRRGAIRYQ